MHPNVWLDVELTELLSIRLTFEPDPTISYMRKIRTVSTDDSTQD